MIIRGKETAITRKWARILTYAAMVSAKVQSAQYSFYEIPSHPLCSLLVLVVVVIYFVELAQGSWCRWMHTYYQCNWKVLNGKFVLKIFISIILFQLFDAFSCIIIYFSPWQWFIKTVETGSTIVIIICHPYGYHDFHCAGDYIQAYFTRFL